MIEAESKSMIHLNSYLELHDFQCYYFSICFCGEEAFPVLAIFCVFTTFDMKYLT